MMTSPKPEASITQKITFFSTGFVSGLIILRNLLRMRRDCRTFQKMRNLVKSDFSGILNILEGKAEKGHVLLQSVTPNFPLNYFQSIEDRKQYRVRVGNFFEGVNFEKDFEGILKYKGKDYQIEFKMNKPTVGNDLASSAREFDKRNMKLYKYQMVSVYGELSYNRQRKRGRMQTKMLCLDWVEFEKYWQMKIIAIIISSFWVGIFMGIACCIVYQRDIPEIEQGYMFMKQSSQKIYHATKEKAKEFYEQNWVEKEEDDGKK